MTSLSKKLTLVLIPTVVLLIGCICLLIFLPGGNSSKIYVEQINSARALAESGDYQQAIVCYRNAIEADDTNEEAYLELADIYYVRLSQLDNAVAVLREGFDRTRSSKIAEKLEYLVSVQSGGDANKKASEEKLSNEEKPLLNSTSVNVFSGYTYEKYSENCTVKSENSVYGTYTVTYQQYDAEFVYTNGETEVLDPSTNRPYSYALPTSIRLNDISLLILGIENGVTVDNLRQLGASSVKVLPFDNTLNTYLVSFDYNSMSVTLGCDENGTVTDKKAYNEIVPKPGNATGAKVEVSGKIIDVTTGKTVPKVQLDFRAGKNSKDGDITETLTTSSGEYSVALAPGDYTVEATAEGYNKEYFDLYVPGNSDGIKQTFSLSPALASNEIRFVLEWGDTPSDLDSHLTGAVSDGTAVDVNFMNPICQKGNKKVAELDIDDTNGNGPETITLYNTSGEFTYKVHRFSDYGSLALSGATVKIYTSSSSEPITVTVPDDVDDEWWTVCTVKNGEVKNINGNQS